MRIVNSGLLFSLVCCALLTACSGGGGGGGGPAGPTTHTTGYPVDGNGNPLTEDATINCEGENLNTETVIPFRREVTMQQVYFLNRKTALSTRDKNIETSLASKGQSIALEAVSLETGELLYSISQTPFRGFVQAHLLRSSLSSWGQCEGVQRALDGQKIQAKSCRGAWMADGQVNSTFQFILNNQSQKEVVIQDDNRIEISFQHSDHFTFLSVIQKQNNAELASAVVDRYSYQNSFLFNLSTRLGLQIECEPMGY